LILTSWSARGESTQPSERAEVGGLLTIFLPRKPLSRIGFGVGGLGFGSLTSPGLFRPGTVAHDVTALPAKEAQVVVYLDICTIPGLAEWALKSRVGRERCIYAHSLVNHI
jgi:hypothetical protein